MGASKTELGALFSAILFCALLLSCGSTPPAKTEDLSRDGTAAPGGTAKQSTPDSKDKHLTAKKIEQIAKEVQKNKNIKKELAADNGYYIYANVQGYKVIYDLKHAVKSGNGEYTVPFSIEGIEGIEGNEGLHPARELILKWKPGNDNTGILLSFDDDYFESWQKAFPLFDKYGAHITFFVKGRPNQFCLKAVKKGHEIAYHTKSHVDLRRLHKTRWKEETQSELPYYKQEGIEIGSFAYPFGFYDDWMHGELKEFFNFLRGFGVSLVFYDRSVNGNDSKGIFLRSKSIDNIVYKNDDLFYDDISLALLMLKFTGGGSVVLFTTHDISGKADWGIKPERLEFLLQEAKNLKLKFLTFREFGH